MKIGIDTLASSSNWQQLYSNLPLDKKSVYFSQQYYKAYLEVESYPAKCFWSYIDERNYLFYPFLLRSINDLGYDLYGKYYDICGAYGYNGPMGYVEDCDFIAMFNAKLQEHLYNEHVVTEFVRYCPITDNRHFHNYIKQINVLDNVFIDLSMGIDWVWNESFGHRVRTAVRKGDSYGLRCVIKNGNDISSKEIEDYNSIYINTMQRNQAANFYFFGTKFIQSIIKELKDHAIISLTYLEDIPITSELILSDGKNAYGFLGGTLNQFYNYKANTYQRWKILEYLYSIGIRKYSMGGGAVRDDGIFKFKMSFAQGCNNPFYIGTHVHNDRVYQEIIHQWELRQLNTTVIVDDKLQRYRT